MLIVTTNLLFILWHCSNESRQAIPIPCLSCNLNPDWPRMMSSESVEEIVLGCLQLVLSSPKSQHKRVLIPNNGFHELRDQTSLIGWSIWQDGRTERSRFMTSPTSTSTVFSNSPFWKEFNVMPHWYQNIGYLNNLKFYLLLSGLGFKSLL